MWLQSFVRSQGRLEGCIISDDGQAELWPKKLVYALAMPITGATKISTVTKLSDWTNDGAAEYLKVCDRRRIDDNQHDVFAFRCGSYDILVPALLFIKALFPPSSKTFEFLFNPAGLSQACTPIQQNGTADVVFNSAKLRNLQGGQNKTDVFRWASFYPSAKRAWASVYQFATQGRCSITLPNAEATIAFAGQLIEGKLFVSSMTVNSIRALDTPYEWAGAQPAEIVFRRDRVSSLGPALRIEGLPKGEAGWTMSDSEWNAVAHLFPPTPGGLSLDRRRAVLDAIVEKLSTGTGWKLANWRAGVPTGVANYYQVCLRNGRWKKFETILRALRESSDPTVDDT